MEKKAWIRFTILVVLIVLFFVLGNKLWFFPLFQANIQRPHPYRPPSDRPEVVTITPFEKTLKSINAAKKESAQDKGAQPTAERNPFLWQGELTKKPKGVAPKEQQVVIPKLGMIIIGQQARSVVLDGHRVAEGESYREHRVEKINPKSVILSGKYGKIKISISSRSFGPPKVEIIETRQPGLLVRPVISKGQTG